MSTKLLLQVLSRTYRSIGFEFDPECSLEITNDIGEHPFLQAVKIAQSDQYPSLLLIGQRHASRHIKPERLTISRSETT